jgi:hypothetical protein
MQCSDDGDARAWIAGLIENLDEEEQVTVFVTLWAWHARRKTIHDQIY